MATYRLKRKTFADEQDGQKRGMSTGKKIALGIGGTALAAGAAFAGARRGVFGAKTAVSANKMWRQAGNKLNKLGLNKVGSSMSKSGKEGMKKFQNQDIMGKTNLTGVKADAAAQLNKNSERAANAGVKLDTTTSQAKQQLSQGTGFGSTVGTSKKPLNEVEYEQLMAFSKID